jgi:hypothetical protein
MIFFPVRVQILLITIRIDGDRSSGPIKLNFHDYQGPPKPPSRREEDGTMI